MQHKRINWSNLPSTAEGFSFADAKKGYSILYQQLVDCKRMRGAAQSVTRSRTEEARAAKADLKKAKGQIITLTKKEHQRSKEKSAAAYASSSASVIVLGYAVVEVLGGWGRWAPVMEHEALTGFLQVGLGSLIAWAMRPLQ